MRTYKSIGVIALLFLIGSTALYAKTPEQALFPQATGLRGHVTATRVNVRQSPTLDAPVIMQTNQAAIQVKGKNRTWYQVSVGGTEGWIHEDYITVSHQEYVPYAKAKGEEVVAYGMTFIGTPYVWGGNDLEEGIDCSGLMKEIFEPFDICLSRVSYLQAKDGHEIPKQALRTGDLVFFDTKGVNDGNISHVGVYVGEDKFLHADGTKGVMVSTLQSQYYTRNYVKAVRVC